MKGIRANIIKNQINNIPVNVQENSNNSNNYNYDYDNYNSDVNEEVFSNSHCHTPESNNKIISNMYNTKQIQNTNSLDGNVNLNSTGIVTDKINQHHKDSIMNSNNTWLKQFDEENIKVQKEAKNLIEQTQHLIENIGKKKVKQNKMIMNNQNTKRSGTSKDKNIKEKKEYLNNLDKHLFDALSNDFGGHDFEKNLRSTKNSKSGWKSKPKYYEEGIMVKSRSPSPPSKELRGLMGKFNSSMINSETNLKSKNYLFIRLHEYEFISFTRKIIGKNKTSQIFRERIER